MASLQDQLLKAGMIDNKKAKQLSKEKRKQAKVKKGQVVIDETKAAAQQARVDKTAKDRARNKIKQQQAEKKAIQAQIIQLINTHKINRQRGDVSYQFTDANKIKRLYVTAQLQNQLSKGLLAIAKLGEAYEVVPAVVADKIKQRDDSFIVSHHQKSDEQIDDDDPYADYQIPDDLMW